MTNPDYLDKFTNLTEMAEYYEGTLHDAAVFKIALLASFSETSQNQTSTRTNR